MKKTPRATSTTFQMSTSASLSCPDTWLSVVSKFIDSYPKREGGLDFFRLPSHRKSAYHITTHATIASALMRRFRTLIKTKRPSITATIGSAYVRTFPLRGRPIGDRPEPLHSGHLPLPKQCGQAGSDESKCGLVPVPLHSSHLPEPSQKTQSPSPRMIRPLSWLYTIR